MLDRGKSALSVVEIVAYVARKTITLAIEGVALVGYWHANLVSVEDPVGRALKAKLLVPVPSSAADIGNLLSGSEDTFSVVQVVSSIARKTSASAIESVALIRDRNTYFIGIENPIVGALQTNLLVPVP